MTTTELTELGTMLQTLADDGIRVVRVLDRHGFGTVESGQLLAVAPHGRTGGVLLRGALDATAVDLALRAGTSGVTVPAQVAEEDAVTAGLACAGGATLLGHPLSADAARALGSALAEGRPAALVSPVDGGTHLVLVGEDLATTAGSLGDPGLDEVALQTVTRMLRQGSTTTEVIEVQPEGATAATSLLVDLWVPVPAVVVVGGGALADAIAVQAGVLGWTCEGVTTVAVAGRALEAFGDADVLVLLDHSPDFDAVLVAAARGGRGFLGLLGSRRTQAARRERLLAAGLSPEAFEEAFHAPVGLDIGSRTPAETAVSIVAEVIAARAGRTGTALADTAGRISA